MSRTANLDRALIAAACATTALWLAACGGSSGNAKQTSVSHTSVASASTSATNAPTPPPSSVSKARQSEIRVQAIAKYVYCLRESGIQVPPPNTTGRGPVFDEKTVNTSTPRFKHAAARCIAKAKAFYDAQIG